MVSTAVYNTASGSDSDTLMCQGSDSGSVSEEPGVFLGAEAGTAAFPSPRTSSTTHRSGQMYRRQESSPTSCAKFLPQGVIEARSRQRLQRDEESWRNWHDEKLPHIFSQLMPYRQVTSTEMETTRSSSEWEPLNSTFVDEYAHVIINDTERSEYVLFVHDFGLNSEESEGGRRYVLVTKYSLLFRTYPFEGLKGSEKELVLHFRSFENMAKRQDAEWLPLDVILAASWLEVDHVVEVPEGERMPLRNAIPPPRY
ncbi:hypothetical protein A1O3_04126 [Capronia epimyces CBS 606.96]|uniref:Uncharacterized protein n=1 Tax=Capronia epimyces CBS 606.96 TaxID=1182542 RepID=W9Y2X6_9EURO|nr:uncharacterized protein A1O3_04126 [Capronia epimyces CBS 606.96]EXJ87167.1 hypothetical protein A1O3_04126 [Capronia epimyces CBS 606.96]